jgi:Kef-type K+ transport system membrane component KefB
VTVLATAHGASGPAFEFLVLFAVILFGPLVVSRLGLPGLIGLVVGGFVIGAHGLGLIHAGNETIPAIGQLGLLYLMFVAGLELDLQILKDYRRAAVGLGLLAFAIPGALGLSVGAVLGWSLPAMFLLGALLASHTLIVYPRLRDAGLADHPAVASAVGATVLTDTLALVVLAVVAGSQSDSGSPAFILAEITVGFIVLVGAGLVALPRLVDAGLRRWGADGVNRFLLMMVALLAMAMLAQLFGIEGIVGAFFAGLGLNRLVPNEGPSMERMEFFGTAVFVPVFLVSIGLLLDPSVMFTGSALGLAALICLAALGGKAIACWTAGAWLRFDRPERAAMYVLTAPQAAATLAVTLIGFEIGLFSVTVVNAVLVLILVSIFASALLTEKVITWMPPREHATHRLGAKILIVTSSAGPTDDSVRAATLLARPDGGSSDLLITRPPTEAPPDVARLRAIRERICRHGFEGDVDTEVGDVSEAVERALLAHEHSLVVVDEGAFAGAPASVPVVVVGADHAAPRVVAPSDDSDGVTAEIGRRLAKDAHHARLGKRRPQPEADRTKEPV